MFKISLIIYCDKSTIWPLSSFIQLVGSGNAPICSLPTAKKTHKEEASIQTLLRMRCLLSLSLVMAASCVFSKFHMRGTLLNNLQKVERFLSRTAGTVAPAQREVFLPGELLCFILF